MDTDIFSANKEQLNKTYLETHKLDLMSEIAELRTRLQSVEQERGQYREKYERMQNQVLELSENLRNKDRELSDLKNQVRKQENGHANGDVMSTSQHNGIPESEYESLKTAIKDLIKSNEDKDMTIDELRKAVTTYQKVEEIVLHSRLPRRRSDDADSTATDNFGLASSTPTTPKLNNNVNYFFTSPAPNKKALSVQRSNSYDASRFNRVCLDTYDDPNKRKASSSSLPRDYNNRVNVSDKPSRKGRDNYDSDVFTDDEEQITQKRKSGFRKFLARLKKHGSQEMMNSDAAAFRRGGVRATAGPRLGWSPKNDQGLRSDTFLLPFAQWTTDQVAIWIYDLGLAQYVGDCRKTCKSGQHMLELSAHEINKELRISNPLHRKKLKLALDSIKTGTRKEQLIMNLKPDWVCKWLDDIGLPQYKDQFFDASMDGRMLNYLTVDDLLYLKINNALHHLSIKRGIETLRRNNFDLATLKRRPTLKSSPVEASTISSNRKNSYHTDVSLWTNHRVMEWLRMIDLSEYAANLRGSGVHGALVILEPRFTVEHLADILNIPTSKTLLRRHLSGHFVNLVGSETQAKKRELENIPSLAITLNTKIKLKKSHPFKRGKTQSEYICPFEIEPINTNTKNGEKKVKDAVAAYKKLSKRDANKNSKSGMLKTTDTA